MRTALYTTAAAVLMAAAATTPVQAQEAVRRYAIGGGPLDRALIAFGHQSGEQILYPSALVTGRTTAGARGNYTSEAALSLILRDTGLTFRRTRPNVFVLVDPSLHAEASPPVELDEVVVTGTILRGVTDGPSPVRVVTRDDIDRAGHGTVAQALAGLPQNFGGTANEATIGNGADRTASNATYASGLNLRGLGSDATLVLINGRRLAGTGGKGDFADISTIPTSAVERVDILLDGASALYGADAVGGVVNIVLRDDYDGAETRLRVAAAGDGAEERQFGQTFGRRWSSGGAILSYEHYDRAALSAADRRLASDADLRWRGGSDRRSIYSNPGNLVIFDPSAGGYVVTHAIPAGQDGTALGPQDFRAGEANLGNPRAGLEVLPHQTRDSLYAAVNQDLGSRLRLSGDLRLGRRDYETVAAPFATVLRVTRANPFFVSPTGAASHEIAYAFDGVTPNPRIAGRAESLGASLGLNLSLAGDWRLHGYFAWASETGDSRTTGLINTTSLREALGASADNPATPFRTSVDGFFNPFADGPAGPPAVIDFISAGWNRSRSEMDVSSLNLQADGTLMELPGGPLKLAVGASLREETHERQVSTFTSGVAPVVGAARTGDRRVGAVFGELRAPLFGSDNARPGLQRLELSLAARFEDYGDIGQTTSPKVGVVWEPAAGLLLRGNYGASFRAPALRELNDPGSASPTFLPRGSQQVLSMILYGGNPDLEPERADTWTFGADWSPREVEGLKLGANWFRIEFDDRIGQPTFENILAALSDPALAPFVRLVDPTTDADDRAAVQAILDLPTTGFRDAFPATSYGAIVDARFVNAARVEVEGMDLAATYAFDVGRDAFEVRVDVTWLDRFDTRATPASPVVSELNRPTFPVGLRGRSSLNWSRNGWGASAGLNYVDSYRDGAGERIDPWLTADLQFRYAPQSGAFAGTSVALTVQNLFDRDPPFYDAPEGVGYDAANANVLGRVFALQLTRAW